MWRDLITGDYDKYTLLEEDTPFEECYNWFWTSINLDETYSKEFLEDLMQMVEDIETGVVETIPADEVFRTLEELAQEDTTDPS
jgi:hypothetical protein